MKSIPRQKLSISAYATVPTCQSPVEKVMGTSVALESKIDEAATFPQVIWVQNSNDKPLAYQLYLPGAKRRPKEFSKRNLFVADIQQKLKQPQDQIISVFSIKHSDLLKFVEEILNAHRPDAVIQVD